MDHKDLLRAYPGYAAYQEALREIFERPPEAFAERLPRLAPYWEPYLRRLLDLKYDIDSIRKVASDNEDFHQWLLHKNVVLTDVPPSLVGDFIRDLRTRFRIRHKYRMDPRAVRDVRNAIESFLAFASYQQNHPFRKLPTPEARP